MMSFNFKKITMALTTLTMVGGLMISFKINEPIDHDRVQTDAIITGSDIRLGVHRPDWWDDAGAIQVIRIAASSAELDSSTNVTKIYIESYTADTYYTTGIVWYDLPYSTISGKWFDLARLNPSDQSLWTSTPNEQFSDNLLHRIWSIFNDGNGVYRPEGASADSRNVSNHVINSLLYGYLTCSPSSANGYGSFNTLNTNFNLAGRTYTDLNSNGQADEGDDRVLDFETVSQYPTGRGSNYYVLTAHKVNAMNALANPS